VGLASVSAPVVTPPVELSATTGSRKWVEEGLFDPKNRADARGRKIRS
jgi:hypothetical protein